jgi:glycosyltransferase involved in cell wall biosynthesis
MRIVMVGPFGLRPRGTMAVRALPLARALAARGHAVTLLLPPWQNPQDAGRCWEDAGVRVENIPLPPRVPLLFHLLTARRLAARALALRPDVVHLFKPKAYSGLAHFLLALRPRARRPRLVVDSDDWEGPGGWNDMTDPLSRRPLYTPAQRRFFAWQERWGLTHADAVTVASRTLESLVWALGVPPERVFYVPNGWAGAEAPPAPRADEGPPVILLYTRFFEFPTARAVGLLRRVRERVPQARLRVVGEGLFGEEARLLEEARQAGLAEAVEYVGWVEPDRLPEVFAQATLAVYPFDDTLINRAKCPVKLLDLLGAGVPVVAEAVGEIREVIRHGETGWLIPPGDEAAFAGAVLRLLEEPDLRRRLGMEAARDIRERRSWAHLAAVVEQAYGG